MNALIERVNCPDGIVSEEVVKALVGSELIFYSAPNGLFCRYKRDQTILELGTIHEPKVTFHGMAFEVEGFIRLTGNWDTYQRLVLRPTFAPSLFWPDTIAVSPSK